MDDLAELEAQIAALQAQGPPKKGAGNGEHSFESVHAFCCAEDWL